MANKDYLKYTSQNYKTPSRDIYASEATMFDQEAYDLGEELYTKFSSSKTWNEFEKNCGDVLHFVFDDIMRCKPSVEGQVRDWNINESKSERTDYHLTNDPKETNTIFSLLQKTRGDDNLYGYESQHIVFECKFYDKTKISRDEVYQVFNYLGTNGKLGFIISKNGYRDLHLNAHKTLHRLYTHDKYLIPILGYKEIRDLISASIYKQVDTTISRFISEAKNKYANTSVSISTNDDLGTI